MSYSKFENINIPNANLNTMPKLIYSTIFKEVFTNNHEVLTQMLSDILEYNSEYQKLKSQRNNIYKDNRKIITYNFSIETLNHELIKIDIDKPYKELFSTKSTTQNNPYIILNIRSLPNNNQILTKSLEYDPNINNYFYYIINLNIITCSKIFYSTTYHDNNNKIDKIIRWGTLLYNDYIDELDHIIGDNLITKDQKTKLIKSIKDINLDEIIMTKEENEEWLYNNY